MLSLLGGWLIKFLSTGILEKLLGAWAHKQDVQAQIIKAGIEGELKAREVSRDVRLATAGFWEMRLATAIIAFCFILHLVLITIDTVTTGTRFEIAGWNVPAFPEPINEWEGAIILSFFGLYAASRIGTGILSSIFVWLRGK